ncbi:ribonuclease P protein subunit p25-like protein [Cryptotermes secundus]|nr:ribonuclease P protein subunit p25-like protein [Cryptotermes secundus]
MEVGIVLWRIRNTTPLQEIWVSRNAAGANTHQSQSTMENYSKGKNVEEPLTRDNIPIPALPANFTWMQVSGGSKMRNLLGYAMKAFKEEKAIVWSGSGAAIGKAISCVEIMKRRYKPTHQLTKICYRKVEEFWEPLLEELDPLVVVREVPTIHILLSKDPLNTAEPGYQAPGAYDTFWKSSEGTEKNKRFGPTARKSVKAGVSAEQFAAMGLRTGTGHKRTSGKQKQMLEPIAHVDIPDTSIKEESKDEPESEELMILP